jgi:hypothetical protein
MTGVMPGKIKPSKRTDSEALPIDEESRTAMNNLLQRVGKLPEKSFVVCFGILGIFAAAYFKAPTEVFYSICALVSMYFIYESVKLVIKKDEVKSL